MLGKLTIYTGCMRAAKTAELLKSIQNIQTHTDNFLVFKPAYDTRSKDKIVSRNGKSYHASEINHSQDILNVIDEYKIKYVFFSEIHMFGNSEIFEGGKDKFVSIIKELLERNIHIFCEGLDTSHKGNPFAITGELMCLADTVFKLTAECVCGNAATRTLMLNRSESEYVVGDSEYTPVCLECFNKFNKVKIK